jgi:pseudouridine synthase
MQYFAIYKPFGVQTTFTDPEGRSALRDVAPGLPADVYAAGRLDADSEGLLLLTDDGPLAHRLTSPDHGHPKTYLVQVEGIPDAAALAELRGGVVVKGERTRRAEAELLAREPELPPRTKPVTPHGPTAWIRLVLREGRKRQIRHMTAAVGYPTLRLVRVAIGPVQIGNLQPGEWRPLTQAEIDALRALWPARRPRPRAPERPGGLRKRP